MVLHSDELIKRAQIKHTKQPVKNKDLKIFDLPPFTKRLLRRSEVLQIKQWVFNRRHTQSTVARRTGLSQGCINDICTGRTYKDIVLKKNGLL